MAKIIEIIQKVKCTKGHEVAATGGTILSQNGDLPKFVTEHELYKKACDVSEWKCPIEGCGAKADGYPNVSYVEHP